MSEAERAQRIAHAFIRCQQYRDRAWRAHVGKNERAALEMATLLQLSATELMRLLAHEPVPLA